MKKHGFRGWIVSGVMAAAALGACDDQKGDTTPDEVGFELTGAWSSGFGDETISDTRWDGFCLQAVKRFDNTKNEAILETTGGEGCGAGYSKVLWTDIANDAFDYCTAAFGEASIDAAANKSTSAISADLTTGCGGFPWSHLTRKQ